MTESATDRTTSAWGVPECPFTIETSARVLDDIRLAIMDAFFSLPRGGAEIGGVLLGGFEKGRLVISGHAALDCEHAFGPSFTLSPPDEARLTEVLASYINVPGGLRPVGWYHSHTRSEIFLSDADLEIHKRFFPEPWQVALVMKPHTFQPTRIGYFFREAGGAIRATASYREEVLEAMPMRQMPAGVPPALPQNDNSARRSRPEPASDRRQETIVLPAEPVIETVPEPVAVSPAAPEAAMPVPETGLIEPALPEPPAELTAPKFLVESAKSSRRWMVVGIGIVAVVGVLGAAFQIRQMWMPRVLAAIRPVPAVVPPPPAPAPALGLNTLDREGQLQIGWDRNSPSVQHASDAVLEINEGGPQMTAIQLDTAHLQTGSFTYARTAEKVDVKLTVHQKNGPDLREVTSFLGKLPERKPAEDPEAVKQRDAMAKQAAKLKADLTFQAAKTKKLEKDVQSMKDEMRRQQQRRMNSQVPDK